MMSTHPPSTLNINQSDVESSTLDPLQLALMREECLLVDEQDRVVGHASKKECHLMTRITHPTQPLLHRAFSVFIFDTEHRLLLQKRSKSKITFPETWTNACCSHPLWDYPAEQEEGNDAIGVKRAAVRKCNDELGIEVGGPLSPESLSFMTRIHYMAPSTGIWGEHEIDYILIFVGEVAVVPNPDEVSDVQYVTRQELAAMRSQPETFKFTPWFSLIEETFLKQWWDHLDDLSAVQDTSSIHRL